jgi:hypothetical protein
MAYRLYFQELLFAANVLSLALNIINKQFYYLTKMCPFQPSLTLEVSSITQQKCVHLNYLLHLKSVLLANRNVSISNISLHKCSCTYLYAHTWYLHHRFPFSSYLYQCSLKSFNLGLQCIEYLHCLLGGR